MYRPVASLVQHTARMKVTWVDWKWRTWKWRTIKIAGHEIAGHEKDGPNSRAWKRNAWNSRIWKYKTWNWRTSNGKVVTEIMMQFLLLFSKYATVWCTRREWLFIKKRQCNVVHYKQFIVANATRTKNIKIQNKVTEVIYCHCKAAGHGNISKDATKRGNRRLLKIGHGG